MFEPLPAEAEQRWVRTRGWLIILALAVLAYGPTIVTKRGPDGVPSQLAVYFAFCGGVLLGVVPFFLADCFGRPTLVGTADQLLSGRTIAGWRTVDLNELACVRVRSSQNRLGQGIHRLVVVDRHRAWLSLRIDDANARRWLSAAVARSRGGSVRISRDARSYLGLGDTEGYGRCRDWGFLLQLGAGIAPIPVYVLVIAATGGAV